MNLTIKVDVVVVGAWFSIKNSGFMFAKKRLLAHYDKWYLKMLIRLGVKGHRFYKLE